MEEKTSQRPLGEKLCQEFISGVLQRIRRALPPCGGDDIELAVRTHQLTVAGLHVDDPAAVGRNLGKAVAHAVVGSAGDGLGLAAAAGVEGDAVEVVLDRDFVRIAGVGGGRVARRSWRRGPAARAKTRCLPSGAPDRVGLHVARVVGAGQGFHLPGGAVVPGQDAARGVEDLEEAVILEVRDVVQLLVYGADGVAVPSGEIWDMKPMVLLRRGLTREGIPGHDILVADGRAAAQRGRWRRCPCR